MTNQVSIENLVTPYAEPFAERKIGNVVDDAVLIPVYGGVFTPMWPLRWRRAWFTNPWGDDGRWEAA